MPHRPCQLSVHSHGDMGLPSRHVTEAGTLGYTQKTAQTHPGTGRQTRPRRTRTHIREGGAWPGRTDRAAHTAHTRPTTQTRSCEQTQSLWGRRGCTHRPDHPHPPTRLPPRIPCPAAGGTNSKAHMTRGEGFWNSWRRNCIIPSNDPFPPPGNKGSVTASSALELTCLSEPPADWLVPPPG